MNQSSFLIVITSFFIILITRSQGIELSTNNEPSDANSSQRPSLSPKVTLTVSSGNKTNLFNCPEQFGYYDDLSDCSKYFVCVFGEALHETCTGGLYFSSELQTCDWPRNVNCHLDQTIKKSNNTSTTPSLTSSSATGEFKCSLTSFFKQIIIVVHLLKVNYHSRVLNIKTSVKGQLLSIH